MGNPWLDIPSSEYIGHMGSAEVAQLPVLNRLVRDVLARARPKNVLLLGCSTGNGLEHVDPAVTRRVSGVDINPHLRELAGRFPAPGFQLDLHAADVATYPFAHEEFDLVHAALLLEYVEWPRLVPRLADALRRLGLLSIGPAMPIGRGSGSQSHQVSERPAARVAVPVCRSPRGRRPRQRCRVGAPQSVDRASEVRKGLHGPTLHEDPGTEPLRRDAAASQPPMSAIGA